jgi:hypothetical protein
MRNEVENTGNIRVADPDLPDVLLEGWRLLL